MELLIDKLVVTPNDERRLKDSVRVAMKQGDGLLMILDVDKNELRHFSRTLMDPRHRLSYSEPAPHNFSFNSPQGACPCCKGLGYVNIIDKEKIIPDTSLSIYRAESFRSGNIETFLLFWQIEAICEKYGASLKTPIKELPDEALTTYSTVPMSGST